MAFGLQANLNRRRISNAKLGEIHHGLWRPARGLVVAHHIGVEPATHIPAPSDPREARRDRRNDLIEEIISHFLVKRCGIPKTPHEKLQRFELYAALVGYVFDGEMREIGLPGEWAQAGELGDLDVDEVVARRVSVLKGVEARLRRAGLAFQPFGGLHEKSEKR
jgi:hypothetical protein